MKRKKILFDSSTIIIAFIVVIASFNAINLKKNINGNNNENIKKSIAYLHKDYIGTSKDINIIDQFRYDEEKVILFNSGELSGIAKFYEDTKGDYKIGFVETLDKNLQRKISKQL